MEDGQQWWQVLAGDMPIDVKIMQHIASQIFALYETALGSVKPKGAWGLGIAWVCGTAAHQDVYLQVFLRLGRSKNRLRFSLTPGSQRSTAYQLNRSPKFKIVQDTTTHPQELVQLQSVSVFSP